ncbi:heavy-metal-associated domain-containing protein [Telmatospirillum siberiense]|uniref:Heavy metal transporter n=1 Tax=Telmatospirillum siberiense TaxID=382514 RepID=A0A2N3PZC1_9PROT|nr:heavy metal-associated domain-containing protein [Telmatospirillum siberiense]PKU25764.1 heavy metal transporter [Telmatospirillum siberiense]
MVKTYKVSGMTCGGCARSVEQAIKTVAPSAQVSVDLAAGKVSVEGVADDGVVAKAVDDAGFDYEGLA